MKKIIFIATTILVFGFLSSCINNSKTDEELQLLCWTGYEEEDFLGEFTKETGIKVKYKTFVGGDQMFNIFTQSKGEYDAVIVDPEYIEKLYAAKRLSKLNPEDYDFADYYEPFQKFPLCWIDNNLYAVLIRWGSNGLVYNTEKLTEEDVKSYSILWDKKVKGEVGIWDWYVPSMGVLSKAMGNTDAYRITDEELKALKEKMMDLRKNVAAIHPTAPEMMSALANEETWIVPAAGEWVAAVLQQQGHPMDWTVPEEGGIMWIETLVIPNDAPHPDLAKKYIQWMQTPKAQALLTQRNAYNSNVPNKKAYDLLTDKQKGILKIHNDEEALELINKLSVRSLPINQSESDWQEVWQEFKAK